MSFHKARSVGIYILATTLVVAGVAITTSTGIEFIRSCQKAEEKYLPAEAECWNDIGAVGIARPFVLSEGAFIGTIHIPSIKKTVNIFQGTTDPVLDRGVGHYVRSVMPGVRDNSVLSGHRDTVFANLGQVKVGQLITIKMPTGTFTYKVNRLRIVDKDDRTVIVPTPEATLTLSTCYPFRYIGNAPKRYIVVAKMILPKQDNPGTLSRV